MRAVNITPHTVNLVDDQDCPVLTIAPSGEVARVVFEDLGQTQVAIDGVEIAVNLGKQANGVTGVPEPHKDVLIIVSRVVKTALPDRDDLVVPDELVRDDAGRVVGCRLSR